MGRDRSPKMRDGNRHGRGDDDDREFGIIDEEALPARCGDDAEQRDGGIDGEGELAELLTLGRYALVAHPNSSTVSISSASTIR